MDSFMNRQFKQPFAGGLPFSGENIQKMVNDSIANSMPDFLKNNNRGAPFNTGPGPKQQAPSHNVFETHDMVIARIPVNNTAEQVRPRILVDSHKLYVKGLTDEDEGLDIPLPAPVRPKQTKAEFRNGVLEVMMQKRGPEPLTEINMNDI
ncbi:Hsp20/alpha crystallin family protein [Scopulibacillus darangshiensis]|nr:Hsp20/alpha crystallin family protein [Scopulibacillus darangshiensis]